VGKPEGKRPQKKKAKMGSKWILGRLAEGCWVDPALSG
jgi:hypothetical protein